MNNTYVILVYTPLHVYLASVQTCDVFCLSLSVCLNSANLNTIYVREFHSPLGKQQVPNPVHIFLSSVILLPWELCPRQSWHCRYNTHTCISFPLHYISGFHLKTKKFYIHILFHRGNNYMYEQNITLL